MKFYKEINSTQNPLIKKIIQLQTKKNIRETENLIIIEGSHLCQNFCESGGILQKMVISKTYQEKFKAKKLSVQDQSFLARIIEKNINNIEIIEVPDFVFGKCSETKTPSGVLGIGEKPNPKLKNFESKILSFILILENISDPGNLGTIIRTAVCSGVEAIFCTQKTVDIWSPKVLRSAQGGHFYLPIFENFELKNIQNYFSGNIFGTVLSEKSESIYDQNFQGKTAFLLGNEGQGISQEGQSLCDKLIKIPMENNFESLNVSTAAAICCFEKKRYKNI